jgi:hypothetical protein
MGGGWNYKRFALLDRPTVDEYRRRVVDESNKKIDNVEVLCTACGFKARYRFLRCPACEKPVRGPDANPSPV